MSDDKIIYEKTAEGMVVKKVVTLPAVSHTEQSMLDQRAAIQERKDSDNAQRDKEMADIDEWLLKNSTLQVGEIEEVPIVVKSEVTPDAEIKP